MHDIDPERYEVPDQAHEQDDDPRCEKCGESATHQVLMREEVLSDERGTVWGHVDVWLCDECDRETGPDPDVLYDEWRDRQFEDRWEDEP